MSSRHDWTNEQETYLLEQLRSQAEAGKRAGQLFKDDAWNLVLERINTKFKLNLTGKQLKSKNNTLRTRLQMSAVRIHVWLENFCDYVNPTYVVKFLL
ncbi:hypothetical protein BDR26DRAFT_945486 [Obelidium mucronatum]|nr:hypothetical protein BDR26DRAFT_945486 [Obelidium mucronatum]